MLILVARRALSKMPNDQQKAKASAAIWSLDSLVGTYRCAGAGSLIPASGVGSRVSLPLPKARRSAHDFRPARLRSFPLHDPLAPKGLGALLATFPVHASASSRQRR